MTDPAVETIGLGFSYGGGIRTLGCIDLRIEKETTVCIAGPNGAGKSTLLLCIANLLRHEGSVRISGVTGRSGRIAGLDPSVFGLVFQDPDDQLFCNTVFDDVAFGPRNLGLPPEVVEVRVSESLEAVGLSGFESRAPHRMSLGERKRAAMAAVLACRPSILALDEPWAGLDARACRSVTSILSSLGGTKLLVTQDLRHAGRVSGRLVILDGGSVVADGPFGEIAGDPLLMQRHGLDF